MIFEWPAVVGIGTASTATVGNIEGLLKRKRASGAPDVRRDRKSQRQNSGREKGGTGGGREGPPRSGLRSVRDAKVCGDGGCSEETVSEEISANPNINNGRKATRRRNVRVKNDHAMQDGNPKYMSLGTVQGGLGGSRKGRASTARRNGVQEVRKAIYPVENKGTLVELCVDAISEKIEE
eukprot:gb/GEZJ01003870.1/.p1 GENE.gb/GEZJ01003870.1/~~gb/GEZJ01003870.1/.p1  ORF type:complete len:180 (-),score=25.81 gb/GEZJ01003870.1/:1140-1679(-)